MLLPESVKNKISKILSSHFNREVRIFAVQPVSGGDINAAIKVISSVGNFFVKWNSAHKFPEMFHKEAKGLKLLAEANQIKTPQIIGVDQADDHSFLVLEYIENGRIHSKFWSQFAISLAKQHQSSQNNFGLDHDNYIGSLYQSNKNHKDWITFFIQERIKAQLKLANDFNLIDKAILKAAERLFLVLNEIIPDEPPALLHGDLWNGNFMIDSQGNPCLIDPAVYYGHREMDLAMTKLFGGFPDEFYEAYQHFFPLENGWVKRFEIHNLYPLLVHVNLFGGQYVSQVVLILKKF
jgi:fructosamine-3-kinase